MTTSPNQTKILDKLEKLLALAGSSNEHEANLAMEKALQIAMENNIELARLGNNRTNTNDEMQKEAFDLNTSRLPVTQKFVNDILCKFFEVQIVTSGNRSSGKTIFFIGKKDKIDFAKYLNAYLSNTFFNLWYKFYENNPHITVATARESYFTGLWRGLSAKLKTAKETTENALDGTIRENYGMIIIDSENQLKDAMHKFFSKLKSTKAPLRTHNQNVVNAGYEAGQKININNGLLN